ncbi:MAG TPA: 2-phospho-L-lactate guanylyltransferase [Polyangiales bacterium]|nr:2-phospho-L-lactate guanylyltransferase [Polyangiales bacterium]
MTPAAVQDTVALIPIKGFEHAKTRLRERLTATERAELARGMFEHVLAQSLACQRLSGVLVLSDADEIAELAIQRGARALPDSAAAAGRPRLAQVVDRALEQLRSQGVARALVLMADLPLLRTSDLEELLDALEHSDVVLAPDARGPCTNALGLRLPEAERFESAFGSEHSLALHEQRARALGLRVRRAPNPRLSLDIDLPADLDALARSREDE